MRLSTVDSNYKVSRNEINTIKAVSRKIRYESENAFRDILRVGSWHDK